MNILLHRYITKKYPYHLYLPCVLPAMFINRSYNGFSSNEFVALTLAGCCVFVWSTIRQTALDELF